MRGRPVVGPLPVRDLLELEVRHLQVGRLLQRHEDVDEPIADDLHFGLALFLGTPVQNHPRAVPRRIVLFTLQNDDQCADKKACLVLYRSVIIGIIGFILYSLFSAISTV